MTAAGAEVKNMFDEILVSNWLVPLFQDQLLDVCRESFSDGCSQHFRDAYLARRVAGLDYILAVMRLNFDKVRPDGFLQLGLRRVDGELAAGQRCVPEQGDGYKACEAGSPD